MPLPFCKERSDAMMYPSLTPRLRAVAELVPPGTRLVDVGTDHAYLPAYLLGKGQISAAIATDIRPGPLERAKMTVERYGLEETIQLRLCDGLAAVDAGEADTVVVAGMGGETILSILEAAPWSLEKVCVLQPMSAAETLRSGLDQLGTAIFRETLVREGDTLYLLFYLDKAKRIWERPLTPAETYVGTATSHDGDPLWPEYLALSRRRASRALVGLERSKRPEDETRRLYFQQILTGLEEMQKEVERI